VRIRNIALAAAVSACVLSTSGAALADSAPTSGKIHFFVTYQTPTRAKILFTGAMADYGTAISQDANGKVDPNGNFEKVTLKQGGLVVDTTDLTKAVQKQFSKDKINTGNCSLAFVGSGPSTIERGTGAYAGIRGKVTLTLTIAGIAPKKNDNCDLSENSPIYGQYQGVTAVGTVSFS
jgi:hypothetical protein